MTRLSELITYLESIAPPSYQMSYDNSQLLVGDPSMHVHGVLTTLDCIEQTIDEAIDKKCNVIIAHHPIIFGGLKQLTGSNYVERTVIKAIKHDIAIYAIHTNLDSVLQNGVNGEIAKRLGLNDIRILAPELQHDEKGTIGSGVVGSLGHAMSTKAFLQHLKDEMAVTVIKHTALVKDSISKVAVCGGAGSFLLGQAKRAKADIFITSDFKYHEYFDADGDTIIADIGHYESEQFTIDLLYRLIDQKFSTFAPRKTELSTNPVYYFY